MQLLGHTLRELESLVNQHLRRGVHDLTVHIAAHVNAILDTESDQPDLSLDDILTQVRVFPHERVSL